MSAGGGWGGGGGGERAVQIPCWNSLVLVCGVYNSQTGRHSILDTVGVCWPLISWHANLCILLKDRVHVWCSFASAISGRLRGTPYIGMSAR